MCPEVHLLIVLAATASLLALGVSVFNAVRFEALKRAKGRDPEPCSRLHASEMHARGLAVVAVAPTPSAAEDPASPQYLAAEDLPSMRGPVPEYVDARESPTTQRSPR